MKLLLDIKDEKAVFFMELLKNFSFVKFKKLSPEKSEQDRTEEILNGLREAVEEVNLIKAGKLKGRPAEDLINEL